MERWPKPWSTPTGGVDHGLVVQLDVREPIARRLSGLVTSGSDEFWRFAHLVLDVQVDGVDHRQREQDPTQKDDDYNQNCQSPSPQLGDRAVCAVEPLFSGWLAEHADRHDGHPENCQTNGTDDVWGIVLSSHDWLLSAITGNMTLPGPLLNKVTKGRSARRQSVPLNYIQTVKLRLSTIPSNTYYNN